MSNNEPPDLSSTVAAAIGGVTTLLALFTGVGLSTERLGAAFRGGSARDLLIAALLCAVAALAFGMLTVIARKTKVRWVMAALAVIALTASLTLGVFTAVESFTDGGRPTITKVSVEAAGDTHAALSFAVHADGVRAENLLRASIVWVRASESEAQEPPFFATTLRPDDSGVVNQEVAVLVARRSGPRTARVQVYWDNTVKGKPTPPASATQVSNPESTPTPQIAYGAACGNQEAYNYAAACAEVQVAGTPPSAAPSPTPSPS